MLRVSAIDKSCGFTHYQPGSRPSRPSDMSIFSELKRRNVLRVAAAYVAVSWLIAIGAAIVGALLIYLATRFKRVGKRVNQIGADA